MAVDVITFGEALIDFVAGQHGVPLIDAGSFVRAPGGAPANVAVGLSRLGVRSAFMGKVGDDDFGRFLEKVLSDNGVDTSGMRFDPRVRTALAFVSLQESGERDFMFYRHPSADMMFRPDEIDEPLFDGAKIFHFGSISMISEPSRSATLEAIEISRRKGLIVSFDPNLRPPLWDSMDRARDTIKRGLVKSDLAKVSEEEVSFITGLEDIEVGARNLLDYGVELVVVTLGERGCYFDSGLESGYVGGFKVKVVDTTGAGDGFVAGLLTGILRSGKPLADLSGEELRKIACFANAVGALTTKSKGAIPSLPTYAEAEKLMREGKQSNLEKK
ncbi:MAG: PfkB family carbohydrate kinase [bacterium]